MILIAVRIDFIFDVSSKGWLVVNASSLLRSVGRFASHSPIVNNKY